VRNEAVALPALLSRIPSWVDHVVVADNASEDGSGALARQAGATVLRVERIGYGAACAAGLAQALSVAPQVVVFLDGDGSDDPAEMSRLVDPILQEKAALTIGCRRGASRMPWHQRWGTQLVCRVLEIGFGTPVRDLGPFRAADARALARLPLTDRGFGWTAEMQAQALRFEMSVLEVPVSWRRGQSDSEISGTCAGVARAARDLLRHSLREVALYRLQRARRWRLAHRAMPGPIARRAVSRSAAVLGRGNLQAAAMAAKFKLFSGRGGSPHRR